jgi:uncharacterized membrane protein
MLTYFILTIIGIFAALKGLALLVTTQNTFLALGVIILGVAVALAGYGMMEKQPYPYRR